MNHHPKNESSLQIHVSINESANYLYVIINNFYVMITDKQFSCVCKIYKCPSLRFYDSRSIVLQYPYWNRQLVHMTICQWIVFCKRNVTKIWKLYSLLLKHGNFIAYQHGRVSRSRGLNCLWYFTFRTASFSSRSTSLASTLSWSFEYS